MAPPDESSPLRDAVRAHSPWALFAAAAFAYMEAIWAPRLSTTDEQALRLERVEAQVRFNSERLAQLPPTELLTDIKELQNELHRLQISMSNIRADMAVVRFQVEQATGKPPAAHTHDKIQ